MNIETPEAGLYLEF